MSGAFNVRVYGILIDAERGLLVSDEFIRGKYYTKFPGGGLEFGEGTRECLRREFIEEMNLKIEVLDHLYTTDFYQESAFRPGDQIISIYYMVKALEPIAVRLSNIPFDFDEAQLLAYADKNEIETFRFIPLAKLSEDSVTLPIDQVVLTMIKEKYAR
jgi:ADP-ribose pyrophosphatase YjhB (NUDIX family)